MLGEPGNPIDIELLSVEGKVPHPFPGRAGGQIRRSSGHKTGR